MPRGQAGSGSADDWQTHLHGGVEEDQAALVDLVHGGLLPLHVHRVLLLRLLHLQRTYTAFE